MKSDKFILFSLGWSGETERLSDVSVSTMSYCLELISSHHRLLVSCIFTTEIIEIFLWLVDMRSKRSDYFFVVRVTVVGKYLISDAMKSFTQWNNWLVVIKLNAYLISIFNGPSSLISVMAHRWIICLWHMLILCVFVCRLDWAVRRSALINHWAVTRSQNVCNPCLCDRQI